MKLADWLYFNHVQVKEFAEMINMSVQFISGVKNGRIIPSENAALRMEKETDGEVQAKQWDSLRKPRKNANKHAGGL